MMPASPFRLVSPQDCAAIERIVTDTYKQWSADWFSAPGQSTPNAADTLPDDIADDGDWVVLGDTSDIWLAWHLREASRRELAHQLLGGNGQSGSPLTSMVQTLVDEAMGDFERRLFALSSPDTNSPHTPGSMLPPAITAYGSGMVGVSLAFGSPSLFLTIALGGAFVERLLARPLAKPVSDAALVARNTAIAPSRVGLEIILGQAELSLSALAGIAVGDVLRLDARYRDPVLAVTTDGKPLLKAHLGTQGNIKAIQIVEKAS